MALNLSRLSGSILVDGQPVLLELTPERKADDWTCKYCSVLNYHWRTHCFKCLVPRNASSGAAVTLTATTAPSSAAAAAAAAQEEKTASPTLEGSADISPVSTKFLLFQPLHDSTTAQTASLWTPSINGLPGRFSTY